MIFSIELINEIANVGYNLKRDSHNRIIFDEVTEPLSRLQWPMNHSERRVWMRRRNSPLTDPNRKPRRRSTLLNILTKRRGRARSHLHFALSKHIYSSTIFYQRPFIPGNDFYVSPIQFYRQHFLINSLHISKRRNTVQPLSLNRQ